jgi:hypothetical protein
MNSQPVNDRSYYLKLSINNMLLHWQYELTYSTRVTPTMRGSKKEMLFQVSVSNLSEIIVATENDIVRLGENGESQLFCTLSPRIECAFIGRAYFQLFKEC